LHWDGPKQTQGAQSGHAAKSDRLDRLECRCGARRIDQQIGLEPTPEAYVGRLVGVFREVRRVLREDGTLWVVMGSSYSSATPNFADCINRTLEGCLVFGLDTVSAATPAKGVHVSAHDEGAPNSVLAGLLGVEMEGIEHRHDDFSEVIDCLAIPRHGGPCAGAAGFMRGRATASDAAQNMGDGASVVLSNLDADLKSEFAVLGPTGAWARHHDDTAFAVEESGEPRAKAAVAWHAAWDTFSVTATGKGVPNVDLVNQSISLRNGALPLACLFCDFKVTQASEKKVTLTSVSGGVRFVVSDVGHLWFSFRDGSLVPYRSIYDKAVRMSNRYCAKQEVDTPQMVKEALQEDGWICRQTIIWAKPNPMPESVRDRCTKSHETVFMLAKSARYYYDQEAIREPFQTDPRENYPARARVTGRGQQGAAEARGNDQDKSGGFPPAGDGRNRRSVWTVATKPYREAHFATFPPDLVRPMILAGCAVGGTVLDPFAGAGTVGLVALELGRRFLGIELNPAYAEMARKRVVGVQRRLTPCVV
jgi:DNA modification methylase